MATEQQKKDAIHESGHAVIAKLFDDDFEVKSITLSPNIYAAHTDTTDWRGGIHLKPKLKTLQTPTLENKDKLIISMWGGLAAQNIFIKGHDNIRNNLNTYLAKPNLLDLNGFIGDWELTSEYITEQTQIREISYDKYRLGFLDFTFNYLLLDKVWETTESLSELVLNSQNLTVTQKEIEYHYRNTGFTKYLYKNKTCILNKRYKVSVYKKLIYYLKSILQ
ncbi:hypothetical protein G9H64_13025 [Aquirufa nivalisilvae]|uniref:hypothetical protein n=1 Tax=Aquirufa nivalisilvae TaxID=2516557 RepID=UPI001032C4F6|nr:hypothetical protein [Aquirufa nivalisilvae]MCZ2481232.1 hypothetical protein [Aquirufa nivalisilvae]MCZ2483883.1 hypothetical protein [Aquirufa nivalisilvae]TBH73970.1 hypothetical protein EWU22_09960 [Aquirufa nivalisilvae]